MKLEESENPQDEYSYQKTPGFSSLYIYGIAGFGLVLGYIYM